MIRSCYIFIKTETFTLKVLFADSTPVKVWLVSLVVTDCITAPSSEVIDTLYDKPVQDPPSLTSQLTVTVVQSSTAIRFSTGGIPIRI